MLEKFLIRTTRRPLMDLTQMLNNLNRMGKLIGVDVFSKDYKYRPLTYVTWLVVLMYLPLFSIFMTRYGGQLKNVIMALTTVGVWAQGGSRLYLLVHCNRKLLRDLIYFIVNVYFSNRKADQHVINKLKTRSTVCTSLIKYFFFACAVFVPLIFVIWPLFQTIVLGELSFALGILLPFIDPETIFGYTVTTCLQFYYTFVAVVGNCLSDLVLIWNILNISALLDLFEESFNQLDARIKRGNYVWDNKLDLILNNIIRMHQDIVSFMGQITEVTTIVFLVQYATTSVNISLSLVSIAIISDWWSAYAVLVLSLTQFWIFCGLGTLFEINIQRIQTIIYNSHWYYLPVKQQKKILMMLARANVTNGLTIGGIMPLNVDSGTANAEYLIDEEDEEKTILEIARVNGFGETLISRLINTQKRKLYVKSMTTLMPEKEKETKIIQAIYKSFMMFVQILK